MGVAQNHDGVEDFFKKISLPVNVVCGSCKRKDMLQEESYRCKMKLITVNLKSEEGYIDRFLLFEWDIQDWVHIAKQSNV